MSTRAKWIVAVALLIIAGLGFLALMRVGPTITSETGFGADEVIHAG